MPRRSRDAYLWDIVDSCQAILGFVQGRDLADYLGNRMLLRAVERELSIVGEAVNQLAQTFPELADDIGSVRQIVGFRNRLIHEYADVDPEVVWAIVQGEVPQLLQRVMDILGPEAASR